MQWRKTSSPRWCVLGKCSFLSPSNLSTVFVWCSPLCQKKKKSVFYYHVLQKRCIRFTILLNGTLCDFFGSSILSSSLLRAANHWFFFFFFVSLRDFRMRLQLVSVSIMCWTAFQMGLLKDNNNKKTLCKTVWCTQFLSTCEGLCPTYTYMHTPSSVISLSCVPWPFPISRLAAVVTLVDMFRYGCRWMLRRGAWSALCGTARFVGIHTCVSLSVSAAVYISF